MVVIKLCIIYFLESVDQQIVFRRWFGRIESESDSIRPIRFCRFWFDRFADQFAKRFFFVLQKKIFFDMTIQLANYLYLSIIFQREAANLSLSFNKFIKTSNFLNKKQYFIIFFLKYSFLLLLNFLILLWSFLIPF